MADIIPNKEIHTKRLKVELKTAYLNVERIELKLMELEDEKLAVSNNMLATQKRISELEAQLKELGGN